jgi:uncharacterized spore protein YtfJ
LTVIPVAKVRYGFGAGSGRQQRAERAQESGGGGGGGGMAVPLGFIEIGASGARFRAIRDPASTAMVVGIAGLSLMMVLRGVGAILRAR